MKKREELIDIRKCLQEIKADQDAISHLLLEASAMQVKMVLVGYTGVGKTTLGHYLSGAHLQVVEQNPGKFVLQAPEKTGERNNCRIGHVNDGTTVPNFFCNTTELISIVDCPGFDDVRGVEQQIKNAFYIQTVFNGRRETPGLNNFVFVIAVKEADIDDRALVLRNTLRSFVRLVGAPDINIIENTLLIITKIQTATQNFQAVLQAVRNSLPQENDVLAPDEDRWMGQVLDGLINSDRRKIFTFHKPTKVVDRYEDIGVNQLLENIKNNRTSSIHGFESKISVEDAARLKILELINIIKESFSRIQEKIITAFRDSFLSYAEIGIQEHDGLGEESCNSYLASCKLVKDFFISFLYELDSISSKKNRILRNGKIQDTLSVDFSILQQFHGLVRLSSEIVEPREFNFGDISNEIRSMDYDLHQLKSCVDVDKKFSGALVNYDGARALILKFIENIKNTETQFLIIKVNAINESMRKNMAEFLSGVVSHSKRIRLSLEELIKIYRAFKAVMKRFSADNDSVSDPKKRIEGFKIMLQESLLSAINLITFGSGQMPVLDRLIGNSNELITIHYLYAEMLNNQVAYGLYIELFRSGYEEIIKFFEEQIRGYVAEEINSMHSITAAAAAIVQQQYQAWSNVPDNRLIECIPDLRITHDFFVQKNKSYNAWQSTGNAAIADLTGINQELDENMLRRADGLIKLGYLFHVLSLLVKNYVNDKRQTLSPAINNIKSKISYLLSLIVDDSIPEQVINVGNTDTVVRSVFDLALDQTYHNLTERYVRYVIGELSTAKLAFWTEFHSKIAHNESTRLDAIRVFSKLQIQATNIEALRTLATHFKGFEHIFDINAFTKFVDMSSSCLRFIEENKDAAITQDLAVQPIIDHFVFDINREVDLLRVIRSRDAEAKLVTLELLVDQFMVAVNNCCVNKPHSTVSMLKHLRKTSAGSSPWFISQSFQQACQNYKITVHDLDFHFLQDIAHQYSLYNNFCKQEPVMPISENKLYGIISKFWNDIDSFIGAYRVGCVYFFSCGNFFRPHPAERDRPRPSAPLAQDVHGDVPYVPVAHMV